MKKSIFFAFLIFTLLLNCKYSSNAQISQIENRETQLFSHSIKALHYGIHLTDINLTNKTIKGYTGARLVSKIDSLTSVKLELASLTVDSVFIGESKTNAFTHNGDELIIGLTTPVKAGNTILVTVFYHGHPFTDPSGWGGFHYSEGYALNLGVGFESIPHNLGKAWFPCIDDFHDRALYDVYLTVTSDKKAISGGLLAGVKENGDNTSTWHWKTDFTLPTYLISATTGKYELITDSYKGLQTQIPITYYCRPSDTARVAGTFVNLKRIVHVFENYFGPYPFERIGFTASPGGLGAMEHASNITYPFSGWTGSTDKEWWYAHELSHMWFGDKVTCASAEDMWLNEGFAVWCESLYREGIYGKEAYKENMRSKLKDVLQSADVTDGGYFAVYGIPQTITYGTTVYQKGGQVAHTLRGYMGDSLFFGGIKAYLQKFAYNYASTSDLCDFLESFSGMDLHPFFDTWVFTPGFPHFAVDSVISIAGENDYAVTVYVRQKLKGRTQYANANVLEITFMDKNWHKITDTIVFSGITGRKTFHLPFLPVTALADPDEKISDATTDLARVMKGKGEFDFPNTLSKVIVEHIKDSAFVRITHNWVAPDTINWPHPGLRISDSRYWTVEGIFPPDFKAGGKFSYSYSNSLDKTLLLSPGDSLVILYRPGAGYTWRGIPFTREGSWMSGTISVADLQRGEYALAVWDRQYLDTIVKSPTKRKQKKVKSYHGKRRN